jgi:hypothetical protein
VRSSLPRCDPLCPGSCCKRCRGKELCPGGAILFAPVQSSLPRCDHLCPGAILFAPVLVVSDSLCPGAILFAPVLVLGAVGAKRLTFALARCNPLCPGAILFAPVRVVSAVGAKSIAPVVQSTLPRCDPLCPGAILFAPVDRVKEDSPRQTQFSAQNTYLDVKSIVRLTRTQGHK